MSPAILYSQATVLVPPALSRTSPETRDEEKQYSDSKFKTRFILWRNVNPKSIVPALARGYMKIYIWGNGASDRRKLKNSKF